MSQSVTPPPDCRSRRNDKGVVNWLVQRIVLDGIFWSKRKPTHVSGKSAIKILRYLAIAEISVEAVALTFILGVLLTDTYVKHEKEEYEMMIKLGFPFFSIRTTINLCAIFAPIKSRIELLYPAYLSQLLSFALTSLFLCLVFIALVGTIIFYLIFEIQKTFIYIILILVDSGIIYLFLDYTHWSYGILDSVRFHMLGNNKEEVSNVTNVDL